MYVVCVSVQVSDSKICISSEMQWWSISTKCLLEDKGEHNFGLKNYTIFSHRTDKIIQYNSTS